MIKAYSAALGKDVKILFRNWTSVFLVIIGPLLLMLTLVIAFSDIGFSNIHIGFIPLENTPYDAFLPKIGYLGTFTKYFSLDACVRDVQLQKLHLCLEPFGNTIRVHFDNTRELISLMLLNQVRTAATIEKEALTEQRAVGLLEDVQSVDDLLARGELFSTQLQQDLQDQRRDLTETKRELQDARVQIEDRIRQLYDLRLRISNAKIQAQLSVSRELDDTINDLSQAESFFNNAYLNAQTRGDTDAASGFLAQRQQAQQARIALTIAKQDFNAGLSSADTLLREIDLAIQQLEDAHTFLYEKEVKIEQTIRTIDSRSQEINQLQQEITTQRRGISEVSNTDVSLLVRPLELQYQPLFLASERARAFAALKDKKLVVPDQQRLINLGATQTFLPLITLLLVSFIATILANILSLDELHSPAFLRNHITPSPWIARFLSQFTTVLGVTFVQTIILLGIATVIFLLDVLASLDTLIVVLLLLIGIYSMCGMIIAHLIKTKTTSLLISAFFLILNVLLGGIVYPVERMAPFMATFAKAIPFSSGISMLQQSLFYGAPLSALAPQLLRLVALFVVAFLLVILARKIFLYRYVRGE